MTRRPTTHPPPHHTGEQLNTPTLPREPMGDPQWATAQQASHPERTPGRGQGMSGRAPTPTPNPTRAYPDRDGNRRAPNDRSPGSVEQQPPLNAQNRARGGALLPRPPTIEQQKEATVSYTDFHPGHAVSTAAERYRRALAEKNTRQPPRLTGALADTYRQASALTCPADPRFRHLIDTNTMTCVRCQSTATDLTRTEQPA